MFKIELSCNFSTFLKKTFGPYYVDSRNIHDIVPKNQIKMHWELRFNRQLLESKGIYVKQMKPLLI